MSTTMRGQLIEDPTIFESNEGNARATFVIKTERVNGHKWLTTHLKCRSVGRLAEHIGTSLHRGDIVIVVGTLEQDGDWNSDPDSGGLLLDLQAVGLDLASAVWQKVAP